jgi:acyl-CoA thioesterase YciA
MGTHSIHTLCMPADTNQYGNIFGGWLLGQMDIAGEIFAEKSRSRA